MTNIHFCMGDTSFMHCSYEGIPFPKYFLVISLIAFSHISWNVLLLEENVKRDSLDTSPMDLPSLDKGDSFSDRGISGV